jgi:iron complex transport system ATP-binding protein
LLRTIAGIIPPAAGILKCQDELVHRMSEKKRAQLIAYVGSKPSTFSSLRVSEIIALGGWAAGQEIDVDSLLKKYEIEHIGNKRVNEISDGEAQKVMLVRAIAQQTPILLMDEPTAFLDHPSRKTWWTTILQLVEEGKTVVMSTHDIAFIPDSDTSTLAFCLASTTGEIEIMNRVTKDFLEDFFGSEEVSAQNADKK